MSKCPSGSNAARENYPTNVARASWPSAQIRAGYPSNVIRAAIEGGTPAATVAKRGWFRRKVRRENFDGNAY
jgi:hypothetical protein